MYEIIKEKDFDNFYKEVKGQKLIKTLGQLRNFLNYRSYYKIDKDGLVTTKGVNTGLIKLLITDERDEKLWREFFENSIYFAENTNCKKIDRMSNSKVTDLEKNLYKIYHNRELAIALRYSKEFYLRDKDLFLEKLGNYILLDRVESKKALNYIAMRKALTLVEDDNDLDTVLHIFLNYIVRYPSIFEDFNTMGENKEVDLYSLAYKKLMDSLEKDKYNEKLNRYIGANNKGRVDEELYERLSELNELH